LLGSGLLIALDASGGAPAQISATEAPLRPISDSPPLTLIGTVVGNDNGFALFVKKTTGVIVLLKPGEGHAGWTLNKIRPSAVVFHKDGAAVRISLNTGLSDRAIANLSPQPSRAEGQRVPTAFGPPPSLSPIPHATDHR
jgi:hypothetical protein